ncbi:hypothetical protein Dip510_000614 [Elusimicrobium posterum]|uniref:hypothetical protein n=1 Tax=Elusimicrobium posterum TaxID=3116653 RepID=UPI003C7272C9
MKKLISLLLIIIITLNPLCAYADNDFGFSILDDDDYRLILPPDDSPPADPAAVSNQELLRYSESFWREAVRAVDGDNPLDKDIPPSITSLRPSFALPLYGTTVSLTGRKTFGIKTESKKYKNDSSNSSTSRNTSSFSFEQEMQLKMTGKIMDRVFVDIDYDDQRDDAQDISVAYKGKPGELVQSAEFGDITLELPKTEFISFNKQLFGAKMHLQYGNANLRLIGSETKGTSKNKQFQGSSVFETITLSDTDYLRRRYYNVTRMLDSTDINYSFFNYQISRNSETIYISDGKSSSQYLYQNLDYGDYALLSSSPTDSNVHPGGKFRQLERGVDYTIDYSRNLIVFKSSLAETDTVVIDYTNSNGEVLSLQSTTPGYPRVYKMLKAESDRPDTGGRASTYTEVKTIYNLSRQQISRDDGKGNFTLVLQDANGSLIGAQEKCNYNTSLACPQVYPDTIDVDFEKGTFELKERLNDSTLYNNTPVSNRNLSFKVELNSKVKSYFVEADMVVQSETVKVNGITLKRNDDYYIDYSSGFLTFYKEGIVTQDAVIDVTYDTTGGASSDQTLLGARFDYDFTDNIGFGGTFIQEGTDAPKTAPSITSLSEKLTVYEVDAKAKDMEFVDGVKLSVSGEAAKSVKDQNLFGYAIVDNFEDAKQSVSPDYNFKYWQVASTPGYEYGSADNAFWGSIYWDTQDINSLQINPNSSSSANDKQAVLVINYDFTKSDEVSIVYPLSDTGTDLSEKKTFDLTALGNANGPLINIHYGNIDEISDSGLGDNTITCSTYYPDYVPKTEDRYCRGSVSPEEDKGWMYEDPDGTLHNYEPFAKNVYNRERQPNGRIDTQDLDNNGRLDKGSSSVGGSFGYEINMTGVSAVAIDGLPGAVLNNTSWETFTTPVTITDAEKNRWTAVKHLRISLKKPAGLPAGAEKGQIKIANVSIAGNSWQANSDTDNITAINKIDDTDYLPIFDDYKGAGRSVFNKLYGSLDELRSESRNQNIFEQALRIDYDTTAYTETFAHNNYSKMDFSTHKNLLFLLYLKNNDTQSQFFMRLGTETNYQEIVVDLDAATLTTGQWNLIQLKLVDSTGDGIPDILEPATPGVSVNVVQDSINPANLNFTKISRIASGVKLKAGGTGTANGEVWLNEIHMSGSNSLEGTAYRGDAKIVVDNWGEAGATYIKKDQYFQTPVSVATGQDKTTEDYYLKLNRISYLPVNATYQRSTTDTPRILDNLNTNTVRSLDQGLVEKDKGAIRVDLQKKDLPQIGVEYSFDNADYHLAERKDAKKTYNATIKQSFASTNFLREYSGGYTVSNTTIDYSQDVLNSGGSTYYNTDENSQRINGKVSLVPWKGSSIIPTYTVTTVKEDRNGGAYQSLSYPKSMTQQTGVTANFRIFKWLVPTASYNVTTTETNNLTQTTLTQNGVSQTFDIGELKSINRTADGGVSLTLNMKEIIPKSKLFSNMTLSNSYRLQDADSYVNVESGYNSKTSIWLRSDLSPSNPYAYKRNMTLRDTITSSQRWNPFRDYQLDGALSPLKSLSIINNFTLTDQESEETGTPTTTKSTTLPDMVVTLGDIERFFGEKYFLSKTSLKLNYSKIENEVVGIEFKDENTYGAEFRFTLFNKFDNTLNYSLKNGDRYSLNSNETLESLYVNDISAQSSFYISRFRLTPKIAYAKSEKKQRNDTISEDYTDIIPSLNVRLDFSMPGGIWLPFVNRNYATTNRIIWNTNLSYQKRRSDVTVLENKNYYDITTSLDYEFSKNVRLTISGGVQVLDHLYVESESYTAYNFATMLTLQF